MFMHRDGESTSHSGDVDLIPGSGRSPGGGHRTPLQYSCLEKSHGQRSLAGYIPEGHRVRRDCVTKNVQNIK